MLFILLTAFLTPFPKNLFLSLSLSSNASCCPVDAPEGTLALPNEPSSHKTSTSTVGFPLESKISLPFTAIIDAKFYASELFVNSRLTIIAKIYQVSIKRVVYISYPTNSIFYIIVFICI